MAREPQNYLGVMVSSTFTDLEEHRRKVIAAIDGLGFKPVVMEHSGASPADVITQSLNMVADCAAYVLLISHKYGQTPKDKSNPKRLSITELEFDAAVELGRPRLLFVMSDDHPTTKAQVELDSDKQAKLESFKRRAKLVHPDDPDSELTCIYEEFSSPDDLAKKAAIALARLVKQLPAQPLIKEPALTDPPLPPDLYAKPGYAGSHRFIQRKKLLAVLDDWCRAEDEHPILFLEAIGGSGKSLLAWTWLTEYAPKERSDWAGRFWYSFYEKGASMDDFCRKALAYMRAAPEADFSKLHRRDLADALLLALEEHAFLMVLDGMERILVAYRRADAASMPDEEAGTTTSPPGDRETIQREDGELLQRLATIRTSKLLVTSRLLPLALLNSSNRPLPGVQLTPIAGLEPEEALLFMKDCGVSGDEARLTEFLKTECGFHPLVMGAIAGLINNYPRARGSFDRWLKDPAHGGALNLGLLNLVQKRNHILAFAIQAITAEGLALLRILSLLRRGVDYDALLAFNPHLPKRPEAVEAPQNSFDWAFVSQKHREDLRATFEQMQAQHEAYLEELKGWEALKPAAEQKLGTNLRDLEQRGLIQWETVHGETRYDLHPVVRSVVFGRMKHDGAVIEEHGARAIDYFTAKPHDPWEQAEALADVEDGIEIVRLYQQMGRFEDALEALWGDLSNALTFNLDVRSTYSVLLAPFFPGGWDECTCIFPDARRKCWLINEVSLLLPPEERLLRIKLLDQALRVDISQRDSVSVVADLGNIADTLAGPWRRRDRLRIHEMALRLAEACGDLDSIFAIQLEIYADHFRFGDLAEADNVWNILEGNAEPRRRTLYRLGAKEEARTRDLFRRGQLTESYLVHAEEMIRRGRSRALSLEILELRGDWHRERGEWPQARECYGAVISARRQDDSIVFANLEASLVWVLLQAGESPNLKALADQLEHNQQEQERIWGYETGSSSLARIWDQLGERERAVAQVLKIHRYAIGPGKPFIDHYALDIATALLRDWGVASPSVSKQSRPKAERFLWETDVRALIAKERRKRTKKSTERPSPGA